MIAAGSAARTSRLVCASLLVLPLTLSWIGQPSDMGLYFYYAGEMMAGKVPYLDLPTEYPPLALPIFLGPFVLGGHTLRAYCALFIPMMAAVDAWQKAMLWRSLPQHKLAFLGVSTLASAALYYTYLKRFDVVAAALTAAACYQLARDPRGLSGWIALSCAVACKLYPVVLAPLLLRYAQQSGVRPRRLMSQLAAAGATGGATFGAAWLLAGKASLGWLAYHGERGLQVATSYSSMAQLVQGFGRPLTKVYAFGCLQVAAPWADACVAAAPYITVAALLATYWRFYGTLGDEAALWRGVSATVIALLLSSKVFSPQYMIWLVPLVSMACCRSARFDVRLAVLLLVACALTGELFPNESRIASGDVFKQVALFLRNALLGVMYVHLWRWRNGPVGSATASDDGDERAVDGPRTLSGELENDLRERFQPHPL